MIFREKITFFLISGIIYLCLLFQLSLISPFTGDELGTFDIKSIHKPIPYKLLLSGVLGSVSAGPENIFYIRLTSALFTILANILWHIFILNGKKELFIFNALILTSSMLARESIYLRYYSYYFLSSTIFLVYCLVWTKNLSTNTKLTLSVILTILSPYFFFTLNALQYGMHFFSVFIIEFVKRPITRVILLFLPFILMLGILIKPISLWWLIDFFNLSDHGHINLLSNSIRGITLSILIKPFYSFYQMFFGYDIMPTESMILIILIIFIAIIFCYLLYLKCRNERTEFIYYCSCFIIPFILIYYFFEAVSLPGFTQLETKHGILILPLLLLMIIKSYKYLAPFVSNFVLGMIFLSQSIGMHASLSQKYPDWKFVYEKIDNFVKDRHDSFILMDGRSSNTFLFYNQQNVNEQLIQYTWEPLDSLESGIKDKERLALLLNDYKSYTPLTLKQNWNAGSSSIGRVKGLDSLLVLLNRDYQLVDSYINYPTFLYLLEKKERKSNEKSFGVWEHHLKDLILPVDISSREKIFSSLLVQPGDSVIIKSDSVLVLNLEKSQDISEGASIGMITANGREIHMIKGENIWDIFAEFYDENVEENKVVHSWYHTPLVSGSIKYDGSYFKHKAQIYYLKIHNKDKSIIKIINRSKYSGIRIWVKKTRIDDMM